MAFFIAYQNAFTGLVISLATAMIIPHGMVGQIEWEVRIGGAPLHPVDLVFIGTMLGWLASGGLTWLWNDVLKKTEYRTTRILLLGLTTVIVAWSGLGFAREESTWNIIRDARNLSYYGLGWLAFHQLHTENRSQIILNTFVVSSTIFALHCILTALAPLDSAIKATTLDYWDGIARVYYHNHHLLLLSIPLLSWRMLQATTVRTKLILGMVLLIEWSALCLSQTRSMLFVTTIATVAVGLFVGMQKPDPRARRLVGPMASALCLIALGLSIGNFVASDLTPSLRPISVFERTTSLGAGDSSVRGRLAAYEMALDDYREHAIVGHGLGAQMRIPWAHTRRHNVREANRHPAVDSTVLTLMFKLGTLGVLAVLILGIWYIKRLVEIHRGLTNVTQRSQLYSLTIAGGGVLAVSLVQANLIASRFVLIFVVWCTLLLTQRPTESKLS